MSYLSQNKVLLHGERVKEYLAGGKTKAPITPINPKGIASSTINGCEKELNNIISKK